MNTKVKTFTGGVHPRYEKEMTAGKSIVVMPAPEEVVIPMNQSLGASCSPLVEAGSYVKMGQKIGDSDEKNSAPVHSSISGIVKDIRRMPHSSGKEVLSAVIENDGKDTPDESIRPLPSCDGMTSEEICKHVKESGIVGMGGAAFPTHVAIGDGKGRIKVIIANGAECEPYLSADHRIMVEKGDDLVRGLKCVLRSIGSEKAIIAIEVNKPDALKIMTDLTSDIPNIEVVPLQVKYPQGAKSQLIKACLNKETPSGGRSADAGVILKNVGTISAIGNYFRTGMPLIERVITVTGSGIHEPKNILVRVGTRYSDVFDFCGGITDSASKIISGGPMMGIAQSSMEVPVMKGTSGILVLEERETKKYKEMPCVRCARCVDACPMRLLPLAIAQASRSNNPDLAARYYAMDCIDCGCCSFICPSRRWLVEDIKFIKGVLRSRTRKEC